MKKILFVLLIALLVTGLIACANAREKAVENMIEEMIEKEGGGDVDIDIDEGGDSIKIETEESEVTFEGDEGGMPWPSDKLPAGFPELKGVRIVAVIDAGTGVMIGFEGCDKNTADAYIDQIKASGWKITLDMDSEGTRVIMAGNDNGEYFQFGWDSEDGDGEITYGSS